MLTKWQRQETLARGGEAVPAPSVDGGGQQYRAMKKEEELQPWRKTGSLGVAGTRYEERKVTANAPCSGRQSPDPTLEAEEEEASWMEKRICLVGRLAEPVAARSFLLEHPSARAAGWVPKSLNPLRPRRLRSAGPPTLADVAASARRYLEKLVQVSSRSVDKLRKGLGFNRSEQNNLWLPRCLSLCPSLDWELVVRRSRRFRLLSGRTVCPC